MATKASNIAQAARTVDASGNIDGDTLDNLDSSQFLRSDTSDTMAGNLTITSGSLRLQGSDNTDHTVELLESDGEHGFRLHYDGSDTNKFALIGIQSFANYTIFDVYRGGGSVDFKNIPTVNGTNLQTVTYDPSSNTLLSSTTITDAIDELSDKVITTRQSFTATEGQTTFSVNYVVGGVDVYYNGLKLLDSVDYTATNGTSVVLTTGATAGDIIDITAANAYTVTDHYTKAEIANHNQLTVDVAGVIQSLSASSAYISGTTSLNNKVDISGTGTMGGGNNLSNYFLKVTDGSSNLYFDTNEMFTDSTNLHIGVLEPAGKIMFSPGTFNNYRVKIHKLGMTIGSDTNILGTGSPTNAAALTVYGAEGPNTDSTYRYSYTSERNGGILVTGNEASIEIAGNDAGNHGASTHLRYGDEGFSLVADPTNDALWIKSFTATGDNWYVHATGNNATVVDAIKVNKTGQVNFPQKPVFSVQGTDVWNNIGNPYPDESEKVMIGEGPNSQWSSVQVNQGNCFNISNGRFTAPVDGLYFFSFHASLMQGDGTEQNDNKIALFKNQNMYQYLYQDFEAQGTDGGGNLPLTMSISGVIQLNAGEYAHAGFVTNITAKVTTAVFSGYMIG
jgi:hypothetical protein